MKRIAFFAVCALAVVAVVAVIAARGKPLAEGVRADRVVVEKSAHTMTLFRNDVALKTYKVALGRGGAGPKIRSGDNKVPEGVYPIVSRNAHSAFHRSLKIGYPNAQQAAVARAAGVSAGDDIMIHGLKNGLGWIGPLHRVVDWTRGCVGLTDAEMDEVWRAVPVGTPVEIRR